MDLDNNASYSDYIHVANGEFEATNVGIQIIPRENLFYHGVFTLMDWSNAVTVNPVDASAFHLLPGSGVNGTFSLDGSFLNFYVTANAGDANEDGYVDLNDLDIVLNHFGQTTSAWTDGNFDGAATIDLNDLRAVLNNLGATSFGLDLLPEQKDALAAAPASAPEPTSVGILFAGIAGTLISRRRRGF